MVWISFLLYTTTLLSQLDAEHGSLMPNFPEEPNPCRCTHATRLQVHEDNYSIEYFMECISAHSNISWSVAYDIWLFLGQF